MVFILKREVLQTNFLLSTIAKKSKFDNQK